MMKILFNKITSSIVLAAVSICAAANSTDQANSATAQLSPLKPFKAEYQVFERGTKRGTGLRTLEKQENQEFIFFSQTRIKKFIFKDYRDESSLFSVTDGLVSSSKYDFKHDGIASEKDNQINFDRNAKSITLSTGDQVTQDWQHWFDAVGYQQQLKLDVASGKTEMAYPVIDRKGRLRDYKFSVVGEEQLKLPIGEIKTIKIQRVRENSKRETFLWLAPEYHFVLARLWQSRKGKEQADLRLAKFSSANEKQPQAN